MSAPERHALLSASSANRWLNCPPSARFAEHLPDRTSEAAEEGRLAHAMGELYLRKRYTMAIGPKKFSSELKKIKALPLYKPEMDRHIETYVDLIEQLTNGYPTLPYVAIEQEVDFSDYAPEGFGTADCIIIGSNGDMHIVDFKFGANPQNRVESEENPQMMLYALGAVSRYSMLYGIQRINMTICQPRLDNIATFSMEVEALRQWGESIKATAQLAWHGEGEFQEGPWCVFCKAKGQCSARAAAHTALEDFGFQSPHLMTPAEIGDALTRGNRLAAWLKDVDDYALTTCLDGQDIPGWKAVAGRSNRAFRDLDEAFAAARTAGVEEALLYERRPITLTALEKVMGPKPFEEAIGAYVIKPPGKPTLAPQSDKREPITRSTAQEDFKEETNHGQQ